MRSLGSRPSYTPAYRPALAQRNTPPHQTSHHLPEPACVQSQSEPWVLTQHPRTLEYRASVEAQRTDVKHQRPATRKREGHHGEFLKTGAGGHGVWAPTASPRRIPNRRTPIARLIFRDSGKHNRFEAVFIGIGARDMLHRTEGLDPIEGWKPTSTGERNFHSNLPPPRECVSSFTDLRHFHTCSFWSRPLLEEFKGVRRTSSHPFTVNGRWPPNRDLLLEIIFDRRRW